MVAMATSRDSTPSGSEVTVDSVTLKRSMGLFSSVMMMSGVVIGSGIFVSPKGVLIESGSVGLSLVVWVLCGIITLLGALCFAELGTYITKSGGMYNYIKDAYGELVAFMYLWASLLVVFPAANAAIAMTFADYIMYPVYPSCNAPVWANRLLAANAIVLLSYVNCTSVKWAMRIQNVFGVIKIVALSVIILTGIIVLAMGKVDNFTNVWENTSKDAGSIAMAFYSGLFSYSGWYTINFLVEEMKNPYVNLVRSIWVSIPMVTFLYVMANVAYFAVLTPQEIIASDAVAVTFAQRLYGIMALTMPVFVACSTFGSLNGCIMSVSRLFFVGAREEQLPEVLALINVKRFTPIPSLIFEAVLSLLYLCADDVFQLINYVSFVESMAFFMCVSGLLVLRRRFPHDHRPIKVNLAIPILFLLATVFLIVFPIIESPLDTGVGIVICVSAIPVYWVCVCWENKPRAFKNLMRNVTMLVQKIFIIVPQEGKIQ